MQALPALVAILAFSAGAAEQSAAPAPPELIRPLAPSLFDRPSILAAGALSYGAALNTANAVTATTLSLNPAVSAIHVDAAAAERGQVSAVVKAVQNASAVVIGHFQSASDPSLKPKMDEGLLGAVLDKAPNLKETLRFLRRLYVPPLGERSVGPSDVTEYLTDIQDFVGKNNAVMVGGVSIGDARGVRNIGSIVLAKTRGLRLIHVDSGSIARSLGVAEGSQAHADAVARVESAANAAGIPLSGTAADRAAARALYARGYRHVVVGDDHAAVDAGLARYADVPYETRRAPTAPPFSGNPVRRWLREGRVGTLGFLMSPDVALARRLARGSDALWIDAEDGQFTTGKVSEILQALPADRPGVVRVTQSDDPDLERYLEAGAAGVIAPQVSTARQARAFVERVRRARPDAAVVVMIETRRGLANAQEIARVPGIDALFIGPHDLSLSLGLAKGSPEFASALSRIEAAARAAGVPLGGLAASRSQAYRMHDRGYGLVAAVSDQGAVAEHFKRILAAP